MLNNWLEECITSHTACVASLSKLPKRVVDISGDVPKVVETQGLTFSRYTTLSHCWGGGAGVIKTTRSNLSRLKMGISSSELSRIFRDAITVTRIVNCQWIWIDSLCIIQDDDLDWKEESVKMAEIYSGSFLNIAATSSSSGSGTLFSSRWCLGDYEDDYREWPVEPIRLSKYSNDENDGLFVRIELRSGHRYITRKLIHGRRVEAPLLDRAWVFQERLLAPRSLHFSTSELIWECSSSLACECTGLGVMSCPGESRKKEYSPLREANNVTNISSILLNGLKVCFTEICQHQASKNDILDFWLWAVEVYSSLLLSKTSDRPIALAGIAQRISDKINCDYLAGIWIADLPRALLWVSIPRSSLFTVRSSPSAPTWSWMSHYNATNSACNILYFSVLENGLIQDHRLALNHSGIYCELAEGRPFENVVSGQIEIVTAVIQGTILSNVRGKDFHIKVQSSLGESRHFFWGDCLGVDQIRNGDDVFCVLIGTNKQSRFEGPRAHFEYVLVLKSLNREGYYIRIGTANFDLQEGSFFKDAEVKVVKIL